MRMIVTRCDLFTTQRLDCILVLRSVLHSKTIVGCNCIPTYYFDYAVWHHSLQSYTIEGMLQLLDTPSLPPSCSAALVAVVGDVLDELLTQGITDPDDEIMETVFVSLDDL